MLHHFQIRGLSEETFAHLTTLSDCELAQMGGCRVTVDEPNSTPCRVSLTDAEPGESVLLIPYPHFESTSPYASCGPIFVRPGAKQAILGQDEIPPFLRFRLLSLRAYDKDGMMVDAEVLPGTELEPNLQRILAQDQVARIQIHNARPGCFSCEVFRI